MNHGRAKDLFSAAYEGELAPAEQAEFDKLLASDGELREAYAAFTRLMQQAQHTFRADSVPDLLPGIQRRLRKRRSPMRGDPLGQLRGRGRIVPLTLTIVALVVLALLYLAFAVIKELPGKSEHGISAEPPATGSDR